MADGTYRELRPLAAVITLAIAPKASAVADAYAGCDAFTTVLAITAQWANGVLGAITAIVTVAVASSEEALVAVVVAGRMYDSWGRWRMRWMWHGGVQAASQ